MIICRIYYTFFGLFSEFSPVRYPSQDLTNPARSANPLPSIRGTGPNTPVDSTHRRRRRSSPREHNCMSSKSISAFLWYLPAKFTIRASRLNSGSRRPVRRNGDNTSTARIVRTSLLSSISFIVADPPGSNEAKARVVRNCRYRLVQYRHRLGETEFVLGTRTNRPLG